MIYFWPEEHAVHSISKFVFLLNATSETTGTKVKTPQLKHLSLECRGTDESSLSCVYVLWTKHGETSKVFWMLVAGLPAANGHLQGVVRGEQSRQ